MTSNVTGSLFKRVWYTWKSYRLPWRRHRFIGMDLEGNTYWEMKDQMGRARPRRIVNYKDTKRDIVDYKLTPQWHQWLRATRIDAPTIEELENDVVRLSQLRQNAALADARWAAKPSLGDVVSQQQQEGGVLESGVGFSNGSGSKMPVGQDVGGKEAGEKVNGDGDPWKAADGAGGFKAGEWDSSKVLKGR